MGYEITDLSTGVYAVTELDVEAITGTVDVAYLPEGDISDISDNVSYAAGYFTVPNTVTTFFFQDDGRNMNAYNDGTIWIIFYVRYGKLYNWYAIDPSRTGDDSFTSSDEWRVPSNTDWTTLTDYCIASDPGIDANNIGNHLKSKRQSATPLGSPWDTTDIPYWASNATHYGLDTFNLGLVPGGFRRSTNGTFSDLLVRTDRFTTTEDGANVKERAIEYNDGSVTELSYLKGQGYSINLVRDATTEEQTEVDGTIVSYYTQNNGYPLRAVKIGAQVWTSEVFETKYRDGTAIPSEGVNPGYYTDAEWSSLSTPAVCDYNSDETNSFYISYADLFTKYSDNPILSKGDLGTWESRGIRDPALLVDSNGDTVQENGEYVMFYSGRQSEIATTTKIGRATSSDKITWTKYGSNPVVEDDDYCAMGSVIKRGAGDYILYYHYDGATKFNYATSSDGINWTLNTVGKPILEIADIVDAVTMGIPFVVDIDGNQYMVFEVYTSGWQIYMASSSDWVTWSIIGKIYTPVSGYFDNNEQANPSLYKVDTNYYIIIYNGQASSDSFDLGILHSNSITSGWERLRDAPILHKGFPGTWDDTRIEGGRVYRDQINQSEFELFYFGLPTTNSFTDGAIGRGTAISGVTFPYQSV